MKRSTRALLGVAIGCTLGAIQAVTETLAVALLYQRFVLQPATFYNTRMYDGFTKLFTWIDPPAPTLTSLEAFIGQGFAPKLAIVADLLVVNFVIGAAAGAVAALIVGLLPERVRGDARRTAICILCVLVGFEMVVHFSLWLANLQIPAAATFTAVARNAARNVLHDGTLLATLILVVSASLTLLVFGQHEALARAPRALVATTLPFLFFVIVNAVDATSAIRAPVLAAAPLARDYNVILISIDSLRADHLGAYGYPRATSPTIDELADGGVLGLKTSATTAWTLPSHMSILTGRSLLGHGVVTDDRQLGADVPTLAESFKGAGYTTGAIVSAPYVEARYGFGRGFDEYDDHTIRFATHGESYKNVTSPLVETTATAWLQRHAASKFFLFLHFWDVHYDYAPGAPYDKMFDPDYEGTIDGTNFYFNPAVNAEMDRRDLAHVIALYDGEIRLVDDHLAKLRAALVTLGVADRTVIVVTGDHGDEFFEHGRKGHHRTLYNEIIHVPLVVYVPGVQPRRSQLAMQTSTLDIMPTLLGLTGIDKPPGLDGADLSGIAFGSEAEWDRETISELYRTESLNVQVSLQRDGQKVIHHFNDRLIEAYDTTKDPSEVARLSARDGFAPKLLTELTSWLNEKWSEHRGRARAGFEKELKMDAETEERLRALGYLE